MTMVALRIVALALLLPSGLTLAAGEKLISISPAQRAALSIATVPLAGQSGQALVGFPAQVVVPPEQERVVAAPVAGLVSEVRVAVGDTVRAGQVLAVLRSEDLISAQRDITQAAVQARLAEESAKRDEALFTEGIVPASRMQASRAAREQARAALAERRAWLRLMGLSAGAIQAAERGERLADSVALVAPIAGVVTEQEAMVGARVSAAGSLFKVVRLDPLWLNIQVPAETAAKVKPGGKVEVASVGASGTVLSVGRAVSAAQTVLVRARVGNAAGRLRLNQDVMAGLLIGTEGNQWRVPVAALARQDGRDWIFVQRKGGFEPVPVTIQSTAAQTATVEGDLQGNEQIAVTGVVALKAAWQGGGE
jgi:RND family efflux transporter MFP subunit